MATALTYSPIEATNALSRGRRIPELDGVRGLAIAFVLLFHYVNSSGHVPKLLYYPLLLTRQMWSGVDLFFVLSGLLIGGILLDHRNSHNYYSTFYARRIHRIFPLYYLMFAGLVIGATLFPQVPMFQGSIPLWTFPLFAQNLTGHLFTGAPLWIGVSWSLAVEEQFYLLLPLIVRLCSRKMIVRIVVGCIVGAPVLRSVLVMQGLQWDQFYALLPCRADALAFGVAAAMIVRSEMAMAVVRKNATLLYACLFLLYVTLPALMKWPTYTFLNTFSLTFFDAMYFLLILLLLIAPIPLMKTFFNSSVLRWLGTVSYCAYLIHQPVLQGMFYAFGLGAPGEAHVGSTAFFATVSALAVTLIIAQISWLVLEKRLISRAHSRYRYEPI